VEGQLALVAQDRSFGWQTEVGPEVQVQLVSGVGIRSGGGTGAPMLVPMGGKGAASAPEGGGVVPELADPPAPIEGVVPEPPLQVHICSGTQSNPSPQSVAIWQPNAYLGMHLLTTVSVQLGVGRMQF